MEVIRVKDIPFTNDINKCPRHLITKRKCYDVRNNFINKKYVLRNHTFLIYDYLTETEYCFDTITDAVKFINTYSRSKNNVTNNQYSVVLAQCSTYRRSWLFKGYGVKASNQDLPWYRYSLGRIIASMYEKNLRSTVYEITTKTSKEYVFTNEKLVDYLGIFQSSRNKRSMLSDYLEKHSLEDLVKLSNIPDISIRELENTL